MAASWREDSGIKECYLIKKCHGTISGNDTQGDVTWNIWDTDNSETQSDSEELHADVKILMGT